MRTHPELADALGPTVRPPRAALLAAAALAAASLSACGEASRGPTQTVEGLTFDFRPQRIEWDDKTGLRDTSGHTYRIDLVLSDARTGARVRDAKVSVNILGLGHVPGASNVTMAPAPVGNGPGFSRNIVFRYASTYRLTFSTALPDRHRPVKATFAFKRPG